MYEHMSYVTHVNNLNGSRHTWEYCERVSRNDANESRDTYEYYE